MMKRTMVASVVVASIVVVSAPVGASGAQAATAVRRPFPAHVTYATGVVPSAAQSTRDQATERAYDAWKATYLVHGCASDEYYVSTRGDDDAPHDGTVSEAMGYGMTIVPLMAGYDADAKVEFDGMVRLVLDHRDQWGMMKWSLDGKTCDYADTGTPDSAIDGDIDIGYGLVLADSQWGGYTAQAKAWLAALWKVDIAPDGHLKTEDDGPNSDGRPSDWILDHLHAFEAFDTAHDWAKVIDRTEQLITELTSAYSPTAKLLSDFVVDANTSHPKPAPADFQEDQPDNIVGYNSLRVPWRLGTDALLYGTPLSIAVVTAESRSYLTHSGGNPQKVYPHDKLDGTPYHTSDQSEEAGDAVGPAAMVSGNQAWTDTIWKYLATNPFGDQYYGQTIKMIVYLVMASDYWAPGTSHPTPRPTATPSGPVTSGPPGTAMRVTVSGAAAACRPTATTRQVTWTVTNASKSTVSLSDLVMQPATPMLPLAVSVPAAHDDQPGTALIQVDVSDDTGVASIIGTATASGSRRQLRGTVTFDHACMPVPAPDSHAPAAVSAADRSGISLAGLGIVVVLTLIAACVALLLVMLGRRARTDQRIAS